MRALDAPCRDLADYGESTFAADVLSYRLEITLATWRTYTSLCLGLVLSLAAGCSKDKSSQQQLTQQGNASSAHAYQGKLEPDDGQWVRPAKDLASLRYSTLDQINTSNVKNLKVAWTFSTGLDRGHEAAPLVVNNTMYIVTPWPNLLYALDLTKPGAPMKWSYDPQPSPAAKGVACCDWVNRGGVYDNGRFFFNTL